LDYYHFMCRCDGKWNTPFPAVARQLQFAAKGLLSPSHPFYLPPLTNY